MTSKRLKTWVKTFSGFQENWRKKTRQRGESLFFFVCFWDWFVHQRIGHFPKSSIVAQLTWLLRCVNLVGHSHLPTQRDCEVIAGAVQWLQWAYNKYSALDNDDPSNKFHKNFRESARFRLKFVVQCALARLSFDNISGVLASLTPEGRGVASNWSWNRQTTLSFFFSQSTTHSLFFFFLLYTHTLTHFVFLFSLCTLSILVNMNP